MSNVLIFDTETTGLPIIKSFNVYNDPEELEYYNNSRVIEIAYIIYSPNNIEIKRKHFLIKPDGFEINNSNIHGITFDNANVNGLMMIDVLDEFEQDLDNVTLVAHNIAFDINVLISECYRYNKTLLINKLKLCDTRCTMKMAMKQLDVNFCIKLVLLHQYLYKQNIIQTHRALDDVKLCADCYFKMILL